MQTFICDICGGTLMMDKSGETAVCEFCGLKYPKARLQEKIQEIKGSVKVEGPVEVVGISTRKKLLDNAEMYLNLGQVGRAQATYTEIIEKYPEEPEGWWGLYKLTVAQFKKGEIDFSELMRAEQYASAAKKLKDLKKEYDGLWQEICDEYRKRSIIDERQKNIFDRVLRETANILIYKGISKDAEGIRKLRSIVAAKYVEEFEKGQVSFFRPNQSQYDDSAVKLWNNVFYGKGNDENEYPELGNVMRKGKANAQLISNEHSYVVISKLSPYAVYTKNSKYEYTFGSCFQYDDDERYHKIDWSRPVNITFILGNTMVVREAYSDNRYVYHVIILDQVYTIEEIKVLVDGRWNFSKISEAYNYFRLLGMEELLAEIAAQRAQQQKIQSKKWKAEGKCPRCGGEMKKSFLGKKGADPDCFWRY
ncbi:MAG: hypothetical protein J6J43_00015 [Oscillospiraceae bacterium]|nr:hypothetical protein [Oscillospiraceae bacterium]